MTVKSFEDLEKAPQFQGMRALEKLRATIYDKIVRHNYTAPMIHKGLTALPPAIREDPVVHALAWLVEPA